MLVNDFTLGIQIVGLCNMFWSYTPSFAVHSFVFYFCLYFVSFPSPALEVEICVCRVKTWGSRVFEALHWPLWALETLYPMQLVWRCWSEGAVLVGGGDVPAFCVSQWVDECSQASRKGRVLLHVRSPDFVSDFSIFFHCGDVYLLNLRSVIFIHRH